jgi:hypothetical protein
MVGRELTVGSVSGRGGGACSEMVSAEIRFDIDSGWFAVGDEADGSGAERTVLVGAGGTGGVDGSSEAWLGWWERRFGFWSRFVSPRGAPRLGSAMISSLGEQVPGR